VNEWVAKGGSRSHKETSVPAIVGRGLAGEKGETKMKTTALFFVLALAACQRSASTPAPVVQTVGAASLPFAQYRTFAFGLAERPPPPYAVSERSFEVERRAQTLIVGELTRKGYASSGQGKGDFLVRFSVGYAKADTPEGYEGPKQSAHLGELVIDAFDGSSSAQVWHGAAEAQIDPQKINDSLLQTAVQQVLAKFPARSVGTDGSGATEGQPH
jgi:hypothetical protein